MMAKIKYSLTFRLASMFSLSVFVVLLLLGFAVLYVVDKHFISQDKMILEIQSQHIAGKLHTMHNLDQIEPELTKSIANNTHSEHDFILLVVDQTGDLLFNSSPNLQDFATLATKSITAANQLLTLRQNSDNYRLLSQAITIDDHSVLTIIALNINHHQTFLTAFKYSMWLSIAIAALSVGLLACIVAKKGLKPLHTLMEQTAKITVDNLSQPLPANDTCLEISQLTCTFNGMLDRLNNSFQRLIGFSSDLAHELRTPLSTMKIQNQVVLSRSRSIEEYQQALQDNAQVLDHMTRMVTDMLFLAKSDNGLIYPETTPFIIHEEIPFLFDFYDYLAQEKGMTLKLSGQGKLYSDKALLRRALSNLITNAIYYGDENSVITLDIHEQLEQTQITITNQGDTIAAEHLPHLFERFYRVESSRVHNSEGSGLGLAVTAAIITAHQGTINVTSKNCQTCFILTFNQHKV